MCVFADASSPGTSCALAGGLCSLTKGQRASPAAAGEWRVVGGGKGDAGVDRGRELHMWPDICFVWTVKRHKEMQVWSRCG